MHIRHAINHLIIWLTPAQAEPETLPNAEHGSFVLIGLITLAFTLLYVAVSWVIGYRVGIALESLCAIMTLGVLRLFQHSGRLHLCTNLFLGSCFFVAILGCSFYSGGIHSMVTPWFVLIPITSVLLRVPGRDTIAWIFLTCTTIAIYGAADMLGYSFPMAYDLSYTALFNTLCIAGLITILSWIAFIFGHRHSRAMSTILKQQASLQRAYCEIEQQANHDALTQLPNRRLFMDRLNRACSESKRNRSYAALMFIDLDNFKTLNDAHGHEAGDLLLIQVAQRLAHCTRETDTIARFGGDEFAVILNTLDTDFACAVTRARIVAEKIVCTLANPYKLTPPTHGGSALTLTHHCTASLGVVLFLGHRHPQRELMIWADEAMYQAKASGKNSFYVHAANTLRETSQPSELYGTGTKTH